MNELQASLLMSLFFALRCMVPFLLTLAIGYTMNRLVSRWRREEAAAAGGKPCWEEQNCPPQKRLNCPTYYETQVRCWQMHRLSDGTLSEACQACPLYSRVATPTPAV